MPSMTDDYYKGLYGVHNLRFVVEMANKMVGTWDLELIRIIRDGTVKIFPELMRSITNPYLKARVIEAIMHRKVGL